MVEGWDDGYSLYNSFNFLMCWNMFIIKCLAKKNIKKIVAG